MRMSSDDDEVSHRNLDTPTLIADRAAVDDFETNGLRKQDLSEQRLLSAWASASNGLALLTTIIARP
jgi:hypothetical protein